MDVVLHPVIPNTNAVVIDHERDVSEADDPFFERGRAYVDYFTLIARCDASG